MKKLLLAAALSAVVASPALAATAHHRQLRGDSATAAFDSAAPSSDVVISNGKVIGADPDPAIRIQLLREGSPSDSAQ